MLSEPSSEVLGALMQPAVQTKAPPDTRPTHGFLRIAEEQASETWGLVSQEFKDITAPRSPGTEACTE